MAKNGKSSAGLGRLVAASLGAALLAVVLSRLRRSKLSVRQVDDDAPRFAPRPTHRNRPAASPGVATATPDRSTDTPDSPTDTSDPNRSDGQPADKTELAGRARAIARPVMPTAPSAPTEPSAAPPLATRPATGTPVTPADRTKTDTANAAEAETRIEANTANPAPAAATGSSPTDTPEKSVVQAAVETTEIDPFAWPEPPVPPPVVPADTALSTLVNDSAGSVDSPGAVDDAHPDTADSEAETTGLFDGAGRAVATARHTASTDSSRGNATTDNTGGVTSQAEHGSNDRTTSSGPFYGWILVAAVFVILCITSGVGFYNASVILSAATRELGASVGAVSGATGLFFAIGGLTGFVFAKRMEFVDIRWFFVGGGLVGGAALLGLRWVTSVPGLYVFFAFFGVAFGLAGLVPATTLVTRWFDRRRSVALSIASTGLSVGGIVVTPFSDWLIDQRTLSGAAPFLAAMWVVGVIPMAVLFVRSYPSDKGLRPDGDPAPVASPQQLATDGSVGTPESADPVHQTPVNQIPAEVVPGLSFAKARTTRFFIALCFAYAVIFFGQVGGIAQLFNMILERTDAPTARTALATLAGSSVIFRLLGGAAAVRLPTKSFSASLAVVQSAALILLAVTNSSTGLILSAAFFGCSIGNLLMLQPLLLAEAFGVANYGRIYSFNQLFGTIGLASGPLTLGLIHDASDYRNAFFAAAAASFIGCLGIIAAGPTVKVQSLWR